LNKGKFETVCTGNIGTESGLSVRLGGAPIPGDPPMRVYHFENFGRLTRHAAQKSGGFLELANQRGEGDRSYWWLSRQEG